jgi:uncharacterized membrane protein
MFPFLWDKQFWIIYFSAFIITFPLTIALFGMAVGAVAAIAGVVFAVFAVAVSLPVGGLYNIVHSLFAFGDSVYIVLAEMGMGFMCIGAGILLFIGINKVCTITINAIKRGLSK